MPSKSRQSVAITVKPFNSGLLTGKMGSDRKLRWDKKLDLDRMEESELEWKAWK